MSATTASDSRSSRASTVGESRSRTRSSDSRPAMCSATSLGPWGSRLSRPASLPPLALAPQEAAVQAKSAQSVSSRSRTRVPVLVEEQIVELPLGHHLARAPLGVGTDPQVDVRAPRGADRAAGVLVEHEALEELVGRRVVLELRVDEHHAAAREQRLVGRQGAVAFDLDVQAAARVAV